MTADSPETLQRDSSDSGAPDVVAQADRPGKWFRGDLDGLRAIAILLIVAYHAGLPGFGGGFVGVDVFFVISGYLITRNLLAEAGAHDRVRLLHFWARRIRRLVPALGLMVTVALGLGLFVYSSVELRRVASQGASATIYLSNFLFARDTQDYFAADVSKSPFLHTWSLGVEEQFYLLWPLLFVLGYLPPRFRFTEPKRFLIGTFTAIAVFSFATNISLSAKGDSWAFYGLPARAWEFGVAGLLAVLPADRVARSSALRSTLAAVGTLLLIAAVLGLSHEVSYPGWAALLPVIGTAALILAGEQFGGPTTWATRVLSTAPMQWTGRVSYSWYLWHWPFLILGVDYFDGDRLGFRIAAVLLSLPVAYAAYRLVEYPLRFQRSLVASIGRTFALGAAVTLGSLALVAGILEVSERRPQTTIDSQLKMVIRNFFPGCVSVTSPGGSGYCAGGDPASSTVVMLVGDSHAATWFNTVSAVAKELGVRLLMHTAPGCPVIPVPMRPEKGNPISMEKCQELRARAVALIREFQPKVVVLSLWGGYVGSIEDPRGNIPDEATQLHIWTTGYEQFLISLRDQGVEPAVIVDSPTLPLNPSECIRRKRSVEACEPSRAEALQRNASLLEAEADVFAKLGIPSFHPTNVLCDTGRCPLQIDGNLLYVDDHHLSYRATALMEPQIRRLLQSALRR